MIADTCEHRGHRAACAASHATLQSDLAKAVAADGGSAAVQAAFVVAEKAHYLRVASSALAAGVGSAEFIRAAAWVGSRA
jgi:hypothetical protein